MKTATPEMYKVYDGQQLAIKVSMNSIYGFTGATFGRLPDKRIASATTAQGRHSIEISKKFAEENYDCEVIYGDTDSIYVKFNTPYTGKKHFDECFRIAQECSDRITENLFKKPMELEFEKMMYPFYLFTKKRYANAAFAAFVIFMPRCDSMSVAQSRYRVVNHNVRMVILTLWTSAGCLSVVVKAG